MIVLIIIIVVFYLFLKLQPQIEYINKSDMYIMWYNARNNQRKWIKLWGI